MEIVRGFSNNNDSDWKLFVVLVIIMIVMISVEIILVGDESRKYILVDSEIIVTFGNERMRTEGVNYIFK